MDEKLVELNGHFNALDNARNLNLPDFPYSSVRGIFGMKLKEYLKEQFGDDIKFDREETFAYIQAHYKGVGIEINIHDGIILSIEDQDSVSLADDFIPIFNNIVGAEVICSYEFCSDQDGVFTAYPTLEWHSNPDKRLNELISFTNGNGYIRNLVDNFNPKIISDLGRNLFTSEGYNKLFSSVYMAINYKFYKIELIKEQNSNISADSIYDWVDSYEKRIELSKENVYQKRFIDDGK